MTHTLQVLHTLPWHQPSKSGRARAQDPTQTYHPYTDALLGGVQEEVTGPNGPPVKVQENTALLSVCGLTGTPLRVSPARAWREGVLWCVHSVNVEEVGLSSPLQAEAQLFVCDQRPSLAGLGTNCTNHPYLPT